MNAERAAGPARHNLGLRKIKYGGRLNNPHAICKRHPQLGPSHKLKLKEDIDGLMLIVKKLRQLIDQKDKKIKKLEIEKNKATSSQAPKRVGPPNKVKGSKLQG